MMLESPTLGQRVKLVDEAGDTGLRGFAVSEPLPALDEKGPRVLVFVFEPGQTKFRFGEQHLYLNSLEPAPYGEAPSALWVGKMFLPAVRDSRMVRVLRKRMKRASARLARTN